MMNGHLRAGYLACCSSLLVFVCSVSGPAAAQSSRDLTDCAAIETEAERLACYDAVLRPAASQAADETPAVRQTEPPGAAQPPGAVTAPRQDRSDSAASADSEASTGRAVSAAGGDADDRARPSRRRTERVSEAVRIVAVRENLSGMSVFTTETGAVYEQTSGRTVRVTDPPFPALLEPASFGSFFLIPEDESQRIRVSRRN